MLGFIITQKCFKSDKDAAIIRYLTNKYFSKMFLKLTKSKKNHEKHLLIAILILCLLFSFIAFFPFTRKKSRYQDKI
jgi:hypothetical protein